MQDDKIIKYFNEKILPNLELQDPDLQTVDKIFSKKLRESDQKTRNEMEKFLDIWKARVLYINMAREGKEGPDKKI